jgi:hypothetical protein
MAEINPLLQKSASTTFKAVLSTVIMIGVGLLVSAILWLSLLPKLSACGVSLVNCLGVIGGIGFLAVISPIILLWCGRGYVLYKVLYELYKLHERPVLEMCAEQICRHRQLLLTAGQLKNSQLSKKLPLPVRLLLRRLDFSDLLPLLKQTPVISPKDLIAALKAKVAAQNLIQKPSVGWFWLLLVAMLTVRILTGWFI